MRNAQNEACTGQSPVNYWMHANMLRLMVKKCLNLPEIYPAKGNISGNNDKLSKAFSPSVARFFMLQAHYRSILDFSNDAIVASEKGYNRLMEAIDSLEGIESSSTSTLDIAAWKQSCYDAMNDDFNSPILIAQLFEGVKFVNLLKDGKETITTQDLELLSKAMNTFVFEVLCLKNESAEKSNNEKLESVVIC